MMSPSTPQSHSPVAALAIVPLIVSRLLTLRDALSRPLIVRPGVVSLPTMTVPSTVTV